MIIIIWNRLAKTNWTDSFTKQPPKQNKQSAVHNQMSFTDLMVDGVHRAIRENRALMKTQPWGNVPTN